MTTRFETREPADGAGNLQPESLFNQVAVDHLCLLAHINSLTPDCNLRASYLIGVTFLSCHVDPYPETYHYGGYPLLCPASARLFFCKENGPRLQ